jgi:phosphoglycolate phosphatase-like HAD superfamily hydrolase
MDYQHIIFDLDGTLVDSASEIHEAAAYVCAEHGLEIPSQEYIRQKTGSPPVQFFMDHGCEPIRAEELVPIFRQRLADRAGNPECVYADVDQVLAELYQLGKRVSLATTKPSQLASLLLTRYGLSPFFAHVQGTDPPLRHKPHPDIIEACISQAPDLKAIMVGDTCFDIEAATQAGIDSVGITLGAHGKDRLSLSKPTFMIDRMRELMPALGLEE